MSYFPVSKVLFGVFYKLILEWFNQRSDIILRTTTIPYHTVPYRTIPYRIPDHTIPYHATRYHYVPLCSITYQYVPFRTITYRKLHTWHTLHRWHTMPYHIIPYHTLYNIPYNTIHILGRCSFFIYQVGSFLWAFAKYFAQMPRISVGFFLVPFWIRRCEGY